MKIKAPYLVAEISANHCGKLDIAKKLIRTAKANNADAVKLQTYTPDTMTIKSKKNISKLKVDCGEDIAYGIYIIKLTPRFLGTKNFLITQKN